MATRPKRQIDAWYKVHKLANNKKTIATGFGLSLEVWNELLPTVYERARQIKLPGINYRDDTSKHLQDQHVDLLYNSFQQKLAPVPDAWKKSAMTHILGRAWPKRRRQWTMTIPTEFRASPDAPNLELMFVSRSNSVEPEAAIGEESSIRDTNDHGEDLARTRDLEATQSNALSGHPPKSPGHSLSSLSLGAAYVTTPQRSHFTPTPPTYSPISPAHHPGSPLVASASSATQRPSLGLPTPISGEVTPSMPTPPSNLPSDKVNPNPNPTTPQPSIDPLLKPLRLHFYTTNDASPTEKKLVAIFSTRFLCYPNSSPPKISLTLLTDTAEEVLEKMQPQMKLGAELFLDKWSAPDLAIYDEITLNTAIWEILEQGHGTATLRMRGLPLG